MENKLDEKKNISPNKIIIPLSDKESGILDDFIQTNDKNCLEIFTCAICHCLAWDPICCSKCDKAFCRTCRKRYGENKICPFKCDSYTFREITRNEKDYLNKISIKCTNIDCSKFFPYCNYKNHLEKCKFRKYHCKNDLCTVEGYINEMMAHSKNCNFRKLNCPKCQQKVKICDMDVHTKKECSENMINCKLCGLKMKRGVFLKEHNSKNNDNPKCLKTQLENATKSYKEEISRKNKVINEFKNRNKDLMKKNEQYEKEKNN